MKYLLSQEFDIGDWVVLYSHRRKVELSGGKVEWQDQPLRKPRVGRVVGVCIRYDGKVHRPCYSYEPGSDGESGYLEVAKTHLFYEVRCGWLNRPTLVDVSGLKHYQPLPAERLPMLYKDPSEYSDDYRQYVRKEMKSWPRDDKGRWLKEVKSGAPR